MLRQQLAQDYLGRCIGNFIILNIISFNECADHI